MKQIGNHFYTFDKLPAMTQFHIVRRLTPLLSDLQNLDKDDPMQAGITAISSLSKISDADSEYVLHKLLSAASQKVEGGGFAPVCVGDKIMYQNIELSELLQIAGGVLMHNLSGFFAALPAESQAALQKLKGK